jgi:hypothetical protein
MPKPYASAVLPVPADRVWERIRDFASIADWHPGIAAGEMEGGAAADQVGGVRRLTGSGGETFRERLVVLDDVERSYTYVFLESPFPAARGYRATMRVTPVTDAGHAFAEWWATFDCDEKDEAQLTKIFERGVFGTGLAALRERFS